MLSPQVITQPPLLLTLTPYTCLKAPSLSALPSFSFSFRLFVTVPLPPTSAIASLATISHSSASASPTASLSESLVTLPALVIAIAGANPSICASQPRRAVVFSSALPQLRQSWWPNHVRVICGHERAPNMSFCHQLDAFPTHQHLFYDMSKPCLRKIDSPHTWVVWLSGKHNGTVDQVGQCTGYDRIFCQHAAFSTGTV